jgi:outer membrane protein TolC
LAAFLAIIALPTGCTRKFYRNQADREVDGILTEKNVYDPWRIDSSYYLPPDPRARFAAGPGKPDRPPMPPDDPATRNLSPNPQKPGKAGIGNFEGTGYLELMASWDAENRAKRPPEDPNAVPATPGMTGPPIKRDEPLDKGLETHERPFLLTLDQAVELALFNSREFQDQRENLYLSALAVTLQRFAFTYQFFATEELVREYSGRERPEGLGNRWRSNPTAGVSKLFPTGALLLFRFANQLVLNMAAGSEPRVVAPSNLSLDVVQPLLRGGGRAVTLEPLTQSERNLVYSIRGFARFRKEFFVAIAGGGEFGNDFAPGSPLPPSGNAPTEGFLPTLLRAYQLENEKQNVAALESTLALFRALQEGGDVSQLQVDQVELDLLNSRANVLQITQQLRDALDRFKQQLGVPVPVPIKLDDSELRPLKEQQQRFLEIVNQFEEVRDVVNRTDWANEPDTVRQRLRQRIGDAPLLKNTKFRTTFPERWSVVEQLSDDELKARTQQVTAERDAQLKARSALLGTSQEVPPELTVRIEKLQHELELFEFERSLRVFLAKPWLQPGIDEKRQASMRASLFRDAASDFVVCLGEARNERLAHVRENWPDLPAIRLGNLDLIEADLDQATALASQTALANRFDLMNARAQVVDAWRQITVTANELFGILNVRYRLDSFTPPLGTQPFDFAGSRTRHALVLNGELPLVRQAERNAYRTALIGYQRYRRILQQAEDQVLTNVRSELRQLRFLAENYKIQQRAVELAYYQVESSLNVLQAPPRVQQAGAGGAGGTDSGSQAALTQQLLNAFSRLLRAQNQLYSVYQNYLVTRYQLYRDLELMTFDRRGVWIDDANVESNQPREPDVQPDQLPQPRVLPDVGGPP